MSINLCMSFFFTKEKNSLFWISIFYTLYQFKICSSLKSDLRSKFVNKAVNLNFLTFHSKFHRLEIMHSDIISILKKCQTINKKFLLRMAKPCYFTHIIMEKNDNSHIVKSRTIIFTSSIVAYARVSNLRFHLFPESDNNISLPHTLNYVILQLLLLIQLSIPILYDKL